MSLEMTKLDAAVHQLTVAIKLFFERDYLSALTLAGGGRRNSLEAVKASWQTRCGR